MYRDLNIVSLGLYSTNLLSTHFLGRLTFGTHIRDTQDLNRRKTGNIANALALEKRGFLSVLRLLSKVDALVTPRSGQT